MVRGIFFLWTHWNCTKGTEASWLVASAGEMSKICRVVSLVKEEVFWERDQGAHGVLYSSTFGARQKTALTWCEMLCCRATHTVLERGQRSAALWLRIQWTWSMAQLVKGLPWRLGDLSSIPRAHIKRMGVVACIYNHSSWEVKTGMKIPGTLSRQPNTWASDRL